VVNINAKQKLTTETQRTRRFHRENRNQVILNFFYPGMKVNTMDLDYWTLTTDHCS